MNDTVLEYHELANLLPWMNMEEYAALVADIRANGVSESILLYEGKILDGRNRYRAAREIGAEFRTEEFAGTYDEAYSKVISLNIKRRHLTKGQSAMIGARMANMPNHMGGIASNDERKIAFISIADAAKKVGVSERQIDDAKALLATKEEDLIAEVNSGKRSVKSALDLAQDRISERSRQEAAAARTLLELSKAYDIRCIDLWQNTSLESAFRAAVLSEDGRQFIPRNKHYELTEWIIANNGTDTQAIVKLVNQVLTSAKEAQKKADAEIEAEKKRKAALTKTEQEQEEAQKQLKQQWDRLRRVYADIDSELQNLVRKYDAWDWEKQPDPYVDRLFMGLIMATSERITRLGNQVLHGKVEGRKLT